MPVAVDDGDGLVAGRAQLTGCPQREIEKQTQEFSGRPMIPKIDFLPGSYHQRRQSHQKTLWRRALLAVFLGLIVIGSLGLTQTNSELRGQRDALLGNARAMHAKLGDRGLLKREISRLDAEANVVTLLRINAAPTRVLAVVTESLPRFVTLTELRLTREKTSSGGHSSTARDAAADSASLFPAERDLARLRDAAAETAVVVSLKGVAPDDIAISILLAALHSTGLFHDAQLLYTDQESVGEFTLRSFAIRLRLRSPWAATTSAESYGLEANPDHVAEARSCSEQAFRFELAVDLSQDAGSSIR
jgi:Tfp pilus assembly protein PilN